MITQLRAGSAVVPIGAQAVIAEILKMAPCGVRVGYFHTPSYQNIQLIFNGQRRLIELHARPHAGIKNPPWCASMERRGGCC